MATCVQTSYTSSSSLQSSSEALLSCWAHCAAIVLCLPITPLLELGAGFCFGAPAGVATVWAAKSVASVATYGIASVARPARLAAATEKVLMEQPRLRAIADDVQARGKEFTLLARLSPVPSWANNYGLALAGVEFEDYLPASVVAVRPALVAHVLVGSSLAELSTSGGDSSPALIALSAASALRASHEDRSANSALFHVATAASTAPALPRRGRARQ